MPARALVACPLEFERRLLARAGAGRWCELVCCGPGAERVTRWASAQSPSGPVVLCGLAGALNDRFAVGTACVAAAVVDDGGARLTPPLSGPDDAVVASGTSTLTTPEARRDLARRCDADLVDLESAAFARVASKRGWTWGVVRGVGDGPEATLPAGIDTWVDGRGRSRPGRVLRALLLGRARIRQIVTLRRDGIAAMSAAAATLERMLER